MISKITAIGRVEVLNDYTELTEAYLKSSVNSRPLLIEKTVNRDGVHAVLEYYISSDRVFNRHTYRRRYLSKRPPTSYYIVNAEYLNTLRPRNTYICRVTPEELLRLQTGQLTV